MAEKIAKVEKSSRAGAITSPGELLSWLEKMPTEWAQVIAVRSAMRGLPLIGNELNLNFDVKALILPIFRASFISWAARRYPAHDMSIAASFAAAFAADATSFAFAADAAASFADATSFAFAADAAASFADAASFAADAAADAAASAGKAGFSKSLVWSEIEYDKRFLERLENRDTAAQALASEKLMSGDANSRDAEKLEKYWQELKQQITTQTKLMSPWINWYEAARDGQRIYKNITPKQEEALLVEWAQIADDDWDKGPEHINALIAKIEAKFVNGSAIPDNVSTRVATQNDSVDPNVDYLDRADTALALAGRLNEIWDTKNPNDDGMISQEGLKPGYVVHLDAPWGGGKTSFAEFVARILNPWRIEGKYPKWLADLHLEDNKTWQIPYRRPWYIVRFNAWQHQHINPPWWAFYQAIRKQCMSAMRDETNHRKESEMPPPVGANGYRNEFSRWVNWLYCHLLEFKWRLFTPKFWMSLIVLATTITALYYLVDAGLVEIARNKTKPAADAANATSPGFASILVTVLLGGAVTLWKLFEGLSKTLLPGTPQAAENYSTGYGDPLERFRGHFARMMVRFNRPILVIVDDLDRCKPEFVVELVRGMQTILVSPRIVFILLGDRDWIEKSFAHVHKEMEGIDVGPEHEFGARFVEKAIQFSFVLPDIDSDERANYVRRLLEVKKPDNGDQEKIEVDEKHEEALEQVERQMNAAIDVQQFDRREQRAAEIIQTAEFQSLPDDVRKKFELKNARKLARRSVSDTSVTEGTAHMIEALVPVMPPNPRQIKRIINALSMLQHIARLEDPQHSPGSKNWKILARWVVLMIEWPKTWYTLTHHPELADLVLSKKVKDVDPLVLKIRSEETVMEILRFNDASFEEDWRGQPITSEHITWLARISPATSGEKLVVEENKKEEVKG